MYNWQEFGGQEFEIPPEMVFRFKAENPTLKEVNHIDWKKKIKRINYGNSVGLESKLLSRLYLLIESDWQLIIVS